jgi:hypothetical protein
MWPKPLSAPLHKKGQKDEAPEMNEYGYSDHAAGNDKVLDEVDRLWRHVRSACTKSKAFERTGNRVL